ncbi:hypothetical protein O3G_MSEX013956 [Manduca sexta]|uniref:PWWP domain-containing protein n=1 Tax=Manduca sexta TaxID=7130 RepID=A0A921ZTX2_MANSE|nr:hypothetical protein O3G_MSEX013956 [Manduca sexta]
MSSKGKHPNGHIDNLSVVKALDFDNKKKKKENKEKVLSKNDLFELEAKCLYQVGDLAWARMGTYPFWPCIVTRDPSNGIFVKKKLFGRIERDIIHVTFFGDNGRRGWIVDNMLKKFMGLAEFESAREKFTPEDKKRDPRLYAAFFISEKKQSLWNMSVHEAETLFKEPKRLRIDILNDMLEKARSQKTTPKTQKSGKITRTDSDVSLSESLYDTLFSEDDGKTDDSDRSRNKMRNKSLDVSEVVTACLDNMAAKTGITKIQRQSHMDRWLQKAKSKTPEKTYTKPSISMRDNKSMSKQENSKKKKTVSSKDFSKHYSLRRSTYESQNLLPFQNEHDYSKFVPNDVGVDVNNSIVNESDVNDTNIVSAKLESLEDDKEKKHIDVKYEDDILETGSVIANEIVLGSERNSITDSEIDNASLNETINAPFSEITNMDVDSTSDTQDSCFSTEKSTETETSDIDSQSQTDSSVVYNSTAEKNDKNSNGCFSTSSDDSIMSLQSCNIDQLQSGEKHVDHNKDFNYTDDSIDSTYTDISNKVDIDMMNMNGNQGSGKKESIHSLSLQLGTEFNLGSTIHSNNMENSISELSIDEDDIKEMTHTSNNSERDHDEKSIKDSIEKDTSTNDTFITVAELEDSIQNGVVGESLMIEAHKITTSDNNDVSFQSYINFNKSFHEDGNKAKENILIFEDSQSDQESTVNTSSDNDTVAEFPNKNEDSVSDLINQNDHEVYTTLEDKNGVNNAISNKSEVSIDISKSSLEKQHIIDNYDVNLSNLNIKSSHLNDNLSEIDANSNEEHLANKITTISNHINENGYHESDSDFKDGDFDTASVSSEDSLTLVSKTRHRLQLKRNKESKAHKFEDPEFIKYLETSRDALIDEHPELSYDEIVAYLHKSWLYEQSTKTDLKKSDNIDHSNFVKGLDEPVSKKSSNRKTKKPLERYKGMDSYERKRHSERIVSINSEIFHEITSNMPVVVIENQISEEKTTKEVPPINIDNIVVNNNEVEIPQSVTILNNDNISMGIDTVANMENSSTELEKSDSTSNTLALEHSMPFLSEPVSDTKGIEEEKSTESTMKKELDIDTASMDSEASDIPLIHSKLLLKEKPESIKDNNVDIDQDDVEADNASVSSEDSDMVLSKRKQKIKVDKKPGKSVEDPEFIKYLELRQDALIEENPQLTQDEITSYLFKTWLYEENVKHELKKTDEIEQLGLVKGLQDDRLEIAPPKRVKKKKVPRDITDFFDVVPKNKPQRSTVKQYYNEDYFDIEAEIESFEITKDKQEIKSEIVDSPNSEAQKPMAVCTNEGVEYVDQTFEDNVDEVELYFSELTTVKPNIFKGLVREKVCDICESTGNLVKCKSCYGMFHVDCVKKQTEVIDVPVPSRGRKKKKKAGRRPKGLEDTDNHSDDKIQDLSEENIDDFEPESRTVDADVLEAQLSIKMKEMLDNLEPPENYSYSSDEEVDWRDTVPGKCEIVDVKLKLRTTEVLDFSDFKCNNCQKYDVPVCFVCKSAVSKKESIMRQRCHVAHCHKFYHLDCLEHWPQTQFNAGEPSRNNKKISEHFEALTCPRHVCHTCVSDDPRGCKTRFSGDKLAKCVRCPATYHSFTKCIPAGTQILTASHIICPRHYEHRPGKVPCHVNTGWCFICALGGSLICCEYCPTSFHAECLNIDPPEDGYRSS